MRKLRIGKVKNHWKRERERERETESDLGLKPMLSDFRVHDHFVMISAKLTSVEIRKPLSYTQDKKEDPLVHMD
jgi:hypothetical protein